MKVLISKILCIALIFSMLYYPKDIYGAEPKPSAPPLAKDISVANVVGKADTVVVKNLVSGDIVYVYNAATGGKLLGSAKVSSGKSEAVVNIPQLGSDSGSVYVSIKGVWESESDRTKIKFLAEPVSDAPSTNYITITNNAGKADIINIIGLYGGETIKVYNAPTEGKLLSTTAVATTKSEANISITQLGIEGGFVYISITGKGELESGRTKVAFLAEPRSKIPNTDYIIVNNNVGKTDTIIVKGLYGGETVKVYNQETGGKLLGSATASSTKTEVTVSIPQLGMVKGYVYISITGAGELESVRAQVEFPSESKTLDLNETSIIVTNNAGAPDTVYVNYLSAGDVVSVYTADKGGSLLGTATVASSKSEATVNIDQLGRSGGTVYVSVTSKGMNESGRIAAAYPAETNSSTLDANNITIINNTGKADTITVSGLTAGDIIKAYSATTGALLGTATAASSATEATISVAQLGTDAGSVYVTVTGKGKYESNWRAKSYAAETQSDKPDTGGIIVTNNSGKADTVYASGLNAGDVVKVYDQVTGGKLLGSATVPASKTEATVSIAQLGTASGSIYVSITSANSKESTRTEVSYSGEAATDIPDINNITVINNPTGKADTVSVYNVTGGDNIKVYDAITGGKLLGSATASSTAAEVTISITQLGTTDGNVYVSLTKSGMLESNRVKVAYSAEAQSDSVDKDDIIVTNNKSGTADTVEVTSLTAGDVVKVYTLVSGGKLLGTATVAAYESTAKVSIAQLGTGAGTVYVTVTGIGKLESARVAAAYLAESKSIAPKAANITVSNNAVGISDTVEVTGLLGEDIIKIYDAEKGGNMIGTATVAVGSTYNTVSISQLGAAGGKIYVSVTSKSKLESDRTPVDYDEESKSSGTNSGNIVITNNAGSSDTIQLKALSAGDVVKVYDLEKGGSLLGSTTASGTTASISIPQLGTDAGSVYVSITSKNKLESDRVEVQYDAEAVSTAILSTNVVVANNVGVTDTIKVTGINGGDIVNVYDSQTVGNLIGTATATIYQTSVTIEVTQLGTTSGSVYITVTSNNKRESTRVPVTYAAEVKSAILTAANVAVANNAGISDSIKVTGLSANDIINVYDASQITLLGSVTVSGYDTSATVTIAQLGSEAGSIYVSVTQKGKQESDKLKVNYSAEPQSAKLSVSNVIITNNAGISDVIKVTGLKGSDMIAVYDMETAGTQLGTATVGTYDTFATVTVNQLGSEAGKVYVSLIQKGKQESERVEISFGAEPKSGASDASNIIVTNNAGASDIIQINGLTGGDVVNVYSAITGGSLIATATVGTYDSFSKITISQLGSIAGNIYVSVTSKGKNESDRTAVAYAAEQKTDAPAASNVTITNNANLSDVVVISFLEIGDVVKIYSAASGGTLMGSGTVPADSAEVTIKITQLGSTTGTAYISVTGINKLESDRTAVAYNAEATTTVPDSSNIKIVNNVKLADTVTVTFLEPDDVIKVYNAVTGGSLLGYVTVASDATQGTVSIAQLGTTAGSVYVSVTSSGKKESARTKADYNAEQKSDTLSTSNIIVQNNAGMADVIFISFLDNGDAIKVYDAATGGNLLVSGTVSSSSTEITLKVSQLGSTAGSVYISVTSYGKLESDRVQMQYIAEQKTDAPDAGNVVVTNNSGKSDTIYITGLTEFDVVKVYSAATGGSLLGTGTAAEGDDEVTIKITQLGTAAGSVYISVTSYGAVESNRTKINYNPEN